MSPLTEGRGLKSAERTFEVVCTAVAPHGGAWIEKFSHFPPFKLSASPLTEGRGLKRQLPNRQMGRLSSPLTEGRGLKLHWSRG